MKNTIKAFIFSLAVMLTTSFVLPPIEVDAQTCVQALEPTPLDSIVWPIPPDEPEIIDEVYICEYSDYELELLALVTMAEAESEPELGKRLVVDTILNRADSEKFPNDIHNVVYQKGQFSSMWNGRINRCYVREDILELVKEEVKDRTNCEVMYFRSGHYFNWGTPMFQVGEHYFTAL